MRPIIRLVVWCGTYFAALLCKPAKLSAQELRTRQEPLSLITGIVVGAANKPVGATHVRLRQVRSLDPDGAPELATVTADSRGAFAMAITQPGSYAIEVSGALHQTRTILLSLQGGDSIHIDVRLRQVALRPTFDSAAVVSDFNNFKTDSTSRALRADADGRLIVDIPTTKDSLVYALLRVSSRGLTPNAGRDGLLRTSEGAYRSVALARNGIARVVVDRSLFSVDTTAESVRYSGSEGAELARISDSISVYQRDESLGDRNFNRGGLTTGRV